MLLSGASAAPRLKLQRPRARIAVEEAPDVGGHRLRHAAGEHRLEVAPGKIVLALEIERACQLQPHPHQPRRLDQHGVKAAMASFSSTSRSSSGRSGRCDAPSEARP